MQFDSLNVRFVGNWPFGPSDAVAIDSARNLAFCGSGGGVYIIDVSNASNPQKLSEILTRGVIQDLFYDSYTKRLYIADLYAGLRIINVANPSNPYEVGYYNTPGSACDVAISGSYAYVADHLTGLQIYKFFGVGVREMVNTTHRALHLLQNIPNPICASTKIIFELPKEMHVSLKIYDLSGRLVNTLVNGYQNADCHSVIWNGADTNEDRVPNGVYFYRLETRDRCITKKLIVMQ